VNYKNQLIAQLLINKKPDITGNPIRTELTLKSREEARAILGLTEDKPLILSFGGSLGAKRVNESVAELIKWHNPTDKFYHIHATGKVGYDDMLQNLADTPLSDKVRIREYIDDMDVCMAAADLVICRAGAITLGELQACGKPSVLIPSPYVAENHQYHNALTLKKDGAAEIIEEKDLTGEALIKTVESLIENKEKLEKMSQSALKGAITDSNQRIYEILMQLYTNA
jgi:UDP-N-acetylglucosamine--N-acetylmuramyl-(pentapeptide) pyrophosphoryl-undecaprenol N-acetylglucosamine transferase